MNSFFKAIAALALLTIVSVSSASAQFKTMKEGDKVDAVVGVVGKYPIYKSAIDGQVQLLLLRRGIASLPEDSLMAIRRQVLQGEIDQKVMLAKADQDSISVSETEIDDRLNDQIKNFVRQLGSEAAVEKQFGKSIAELKASPELRDRTKETIMAEKERYKLSMPTTASRKDVEQFFSIYKDSLPPVSAEVELATIVKLVKAQENQKQKTKQFAQSLVDSLRHGADFAALARRYSQHGTAKNGGDLGDFFPRGTFLPEFEEAAFKLRPGEVSNVVETQQGYHIIKMIERRGEEIHVAQILIKANASTMDEDSVRRELLSIRDRALKGEDFGKLASQYSDDQETKPMGGVLGKVRVEDLSPEQASVIDSLKEGEVSMPLHIAYSPTLTGFQIVKLLKKIPPHAVSLDLDYKELEATAVQWKQTQEMQRFVTAARTGVYMDIKDLKQFYN